MKKLSILMAILLLLGTTTFALAAPKGGKSGMGQGMGNCPGYGMGHGKGWGMGPCAGGPGMMAALNLSTEQLSKVQALREAHWKDITPIREQLFSKKNELRMLWAQSNPDKDKVLAVQKEVSDLKGQLHEKRALYQLEFRNLLTPEQRTKLSVYGGGMGGMGCGRGIGGGHGRHHGMDRDTNS